MRKDAARVRNIADAENMAYRADVHWEHERVRRETKEAAKAHGYRWPHLDDGVIPYVCPICGASVTLTGTQQHIAWHEQMQATPRKGDQT
jgi:hypothetical protein